MTTKLQATTYTSKPDARGNGGGIVYVEVSHADVAAMLFGSGAQAVLHAAGLRNLVRPADVMYGRGRYGGDTYIRIKQDVYEGHAVAKAPSAGRVAQPYVPGRGAMSQHASTPAQPAASQGVSLTDLAAQVAALTQALTAAKGAAPVPVAAKGKASTAMTKA